jgi:hypothetical protein
MQWITFQVKRGACGESQGCFTQSRKGLRISFAMSVCPSVCIQVYQCESHWTDYSNILYWRLCWELTNLVKTRQKYLALNINTWRGFTFAGVINTHSVGQRFSWRAYRFSDVQGCPHILWNAMVYNPIHQYPPSFLIMSHIIPVHVLESHYQTIHLNIILPSRPRSSKRFFSSCFTAKLLYTRTPLLSPIPANAHPSHSSWFDHPNNIWWGVNVIKLLVISF